MRVSLFVMNRSRVLGPLVGSVISWVRLLSARLSTNFRVSSGCEHDGLRQLLRQSKPGMFISPAIQMWEPDLLQIRRSGMSKLAKLTSLPSFGL